MFVATAKPSAALMRAQTSKCCLNITKMNK